MGLKIQDSQTSTESVLKSCLQPISSSRSAFVSPFDQQESPMFVSLGVAQSSALAQVNPQTSLQNIRHHERTYLMPPNVSNTHHAYNNFSEAEMSFGGLPVLEDDILNTILDPSKSSDERDPASHQTEVFSKGSQMYYCGVTMGGFPLKTLPPHSRWDPLSPPYEQEKKKQSNLVTQFPHKEKIEGFDFKVHFPSDSPKLVVSSDGENKRIHSVNDSVVAIFFNHSAGPHAKIRLLVVFSNDGESTTPVHPCRNHQSLAHPAHIMEVSGVSEISWENSPHPSILIVPCETNSSHFSINFTSENLQNKELIPQHPNSNLPSSCAQLKFLCRNSCLTRKDLTLICQLERSHEILARESFLLKVSACPRRDAKARKGPNWTTQTGQIKRRKTWSNEFEKPLKRSLFTSDPQQQYDDQKDGNTEPTSLMTMVMEAKKTAFMNAMSSMFQSLHPDEFSEEAEKFDKRWKEFICPNNDNA